MEFDDLRRLYGPAVDTLMPLLTESAGQVLQGEISVRSDEPVELAGDFEPTQDFPLLRLSLGSTTEASYGHIILLNNTLAGLMYGWMIGGEPPEEVTEEHHDAVKELVSQVLGQLQAALDGEDYSFTAGDVSIKEVRTVDEIRHPETGLVAEHHIKYGDGEEEYLITHILQGELVPTEETGEEAASDEGEAAEVPEGVEDMAEDLIGDESVAEDVIEGLAEDLPDTGELGVDTDLSGLFEDTAGEVVEARPARFEEFGEEKRPNGKGRKIDMLLDVELDVTVELGRKNMFVEEILKLGKGAVVELDKLAGEPVDILVNGKKLAEGEVVVIEDHFGVRLTHLLDPADRIKSLGR